MPTFWVALSAASLMTPVQGHSAPPTQNVRQVYGDLVVEAKSATFTKEKVTFQQGVRATFGQEILTSDSLTLYPQDKRGEATGHVTVTDPAGYLSADDLTFSWKPEAKGGNARNVHLDLAGVMIDAATAESIPGTQPEEVFTNVVGTSCGREKRPLYTIHSPRVVFYPGKEGIIRHPTVYLYGHRIVTLPTHRFSLDPRVKGIPMPGIALGKGKKQLGIVWAPSSFIDQHTAWSLDFRSFRGEHITGDAYVTRSFLPADLSTTLISPHSEFSERFTGSYFDSIRVKDPASAGNLQSARRNALSFGTSWNRASLNDPNKGDIYSKFAEAVYELGGPVGRYGYQTTLRAEDIRLNDNPFHARLVGDGTLGAASHELARNLFGTARIDASTYLGTRTSGWLREEIGAYTKPTTWATVGLALGHGDEAGRVLFPADRLLIRNEGMGRMDFSLGPRSFSYLLKRDFDRKKWYREYMASQVVGCLQVYVVSRQFPRSYQLAVTLRIDQFLSILRSRKVALQGTAPTGATSQGTPPNHVHP